MPIKKYLYNKKNHINQSFNSFNESIYKFNERFKDIKYLITENIYRKLKSDTNGHINNLNIIDLCKHLISTNSNIIIDIYII